MLMSIVTVLTRKLWESEGRNWGRRSLDCPWENAQYLGHRCIMVVSRPGEEVALALIHGNAVPFVRHRKHSFILSFFRRPLRIPTKRCVQGGRVPSSTERIYVGRGRWASTQLSKESSHKVWPVSLGNERGGRLGGEERRGLWDGTSKTGRLGKGRGRTSWQREKQAKASRQRRAFHTWGVGEKTHTMSRGEGAGSGKCSRRARWPQSFCQPGGYKPDFIFLSP